jgi:hypothetical protein
VRVRYPAYINNKHQATINTKTRKNSKQNEQQMNKQQQTINTKQQKTASNNKKQ